MAKNRRGRNSQNGLPTKARNTLDQTIEIVTIQYKVSRYKNKDTRNLVFGVDDGLYQ